MQLGDVVAGRFDVELEANSGGMGKVYRARDRETGGAVAVKVLLSTRSLHGQRFEQEAVMLAELNHPGIVRYLAHGRMPSGEAYLVTEWLDGENLSDRLRRRGMTLDECLTLGLLVARALDAAHRCGILHRDLKPSNLFLVDADVEKVKILDFGLARRIAGGLQITGTGGVVGTPGYMAPEQARGIRDIDVRVDIFSLGCVLFKCLTGRQAFAGQHELAVLMRIVLEEAPSVTEYDPTIPKAFDALITRMLSKLAGNRPPDAGVVAAEIEALCEGRAALALLEGALELADGRERKSSVRAPVQERERGHGSETYVEAQGLTQSEQRMLCLVLARVALAELRSEERTLEEDSTSMDAADEAGNAERSTIREGSSRGRVLRAEVERHHGTLMVLADGSVVVVLTATGTPIDLAAETARCALAIQMLLPGVSMAVVSGRGVISARLPVGEIIDRGVALLAAADPSIIRVDELTAQLLDARFDVVTDAVGAVLYGEREGVDAGRPLLGQPTACVGRERDLATLEAIFAECAAEPVARAALVTAAAGVGKSRLRAEFLRRLQKRGEPIAIWSGRGDPMSAGSSFALLARVMRGACELVEGEPIEERRRKLTARVARRVGEGSRTRVTEFLGELCGTPFPDEHRTELWAARRSAVLMGDQMRRAWDDFLTAECSAQPVLIVLEDLHWGDLPTVKILETSLGNLRDRPLMVLALGRPEVHALFPKMWLSRAAQEIRLGPLTRKASARMVHQVLGEDASAATVARLVECADGNAFYLEELIRVVAAGEDAVLPETVLAMVQARLDGLAPSQRSALRAASIFGHTFWRDGVEALLGGPKHGEVIDAWLGVLEQREVISRRDPGRFPGREEYVFRHALLREGAYAMLTEGDRALGHRLAGHWLMEAGESDAMVLAEHFERGGELGRAVPWYRRAAEHALEGNDLEAVIARAERGAVCGAEGEPLGALRLLQAEAHRWRGEYVSAVARSHEAMKALRRGGTLWYLAAGESAIAAGNLGDHEQVLVVVDALCDEGLEIDSGCSRSSWEPRSAGARASAARASAVARAATQLLFAGRRELAGALLLQIDERLGGPSDGDFAAVARAHSARAWQALVEGEPERYLRLSQASAASFEQAGDLRNACRERVVSGSAHLELGAHAEAERTLAGALDEAKRMGLPTVAAMAQSTLGMVFARQGRLDVALAAKRAAVEAFRSYGNARLEATSRAHLAQIHVLHGDLSEAQREARAAVAMPAATLPTRAHTLAVLAEVLLACGGVTEALSTAEEAAGVGALLGASHAGEALLLLTHARALQAAGDGPGARRVIATARERLQERATTIEDPALAVSFLERVPENSMTLDLAAQWL